MKLVDFQTVRLAVPGGPCPCGGAYWRWAAGGRAHEGDWRVMDDDAALPHARRGSAARHRRATGSASSTLTPPIGMAPVPHDPAPAARAPVEPPPVAPAPPASAGPDAAVGLCVCLHARAAHEHYRRGSDCGVCGADGCAAYRKRGGALRQLLRQIGLVR